MRRCAIGVATVGTLLVLAAASSGCSFGGGGKGNDRKGDDRKGARYSSTDTREKWRTRLRDESRASVRIGFDPLGHLRSAAGVFPLQAKGPEGGRAWLESHGQMLGLPARERLDVVAHEPFFRFDGEADRAVGERYVYRVERDGYPFAGLEISALVDAKGRTLLGVYNGYAPSLKGFKRPRPLGEEEAWQVAERAVGSPLTRVSATQTWFDRSWALERVSGTSELHWRLRGVDVQGQVRHVFVRSADGTVAYATPARADFSVRQTDKDDAGHVLWDSQTLPAGCTAGSPGCSGRALEDSRRSREVIPRVVDIWFRLSAGGTPPFVWPFTQRIDNGNRAITAIVAHDGSTCSLPCRINGTTYFFPLDTDTVELDPSSTSGNLVLRAPSTVAPDLFGHEYGHGLLERLKVMHPGGFDEGKKQPATFTEAMADFIGVVTEDVYLNERYQCCGTDFQILSTRWSKDGQKFLDYAPVSWSLRTGDCTGHGRARLGRAFWNAWQEDASFYGDRPQSVRNATFRAWWIDIMRSFALVGDFPTITDLYNATQSRLGGYALIEAGVSYRLAYEMEKLGLDRGGCL